MARTTILTPDIIETIGRLIDSGLTITAICGAIGVTPAAFYQWMNKGQQAEADPIYIELVDTVQKSRAALQARWLSRIEDAAADPKTWTAAAWLLERSFPQDFGRRTSVDVTVNEGTIAEIERLAIELGVEDPSKEIEEDND